MSALPQVLIGLFLIAHGLVHPILTIIPDNQVEDAPIGTFWNKSWLFGETPIVKTIIYALSGLAAVLLLLAGLSFMDFLLPVTWWRTLWIGGAGLSAFLLLFFWHPWFVVGLVLDAVMFGIGVLLFVRRSEHSETIGIIGAVLIIITGMVNITTAPVFPQDAWGSPATFPGEMHKILAGVLALLSMSATLLLGIWLKRTRIFPGFGTYSFITFAIVLLTGGFAVEKLGTPIMGLTKRITILTGL